MQPSRGCPTGQRSAGTARVPDTGAGHGRERALRVYWAVVLDLKQRQGGRRMGRCLLAVVNAMLSGLKIAPLRPPPVPR